jgi:hypothetical protein
VEPSPERDTRADSHAGRFTFISGCVSEILGGPTNGSENAFLLYTRMAPGAHGPAFVDAAR